MATLSIKSLRVPLRHKLGREVVIVVVLELQGKISVDGTLAVEEDLVKLIVKTFLIAHPIE